MCIRDRTDIGGTGEIPHKALITLTAREFKFRRGLSSEDLRKDIQIQLLEKFPGIAISVEKIQEGPPTGYPVNIEISGEDYEELVESAISMRNFLSEENICLLYTSPSPRDKRQSRMPSSA